MFLDELNARGYLYQGTDNDSLREFVLNGGKIVGYIGFDCTADSLHVGSLLQIMMMRFLCREGARVIALLGGGTTKVGDPSGKDKTRVMLSNEDIERNKQGIKNILVKFLNNEDVIFVDNDEWLSDLKYIDFLRDIGSKFSVNRMLNFDSVKMRLEREQNLNFLEFNYILMQAYDFVELNKRYACNLQLGGADQWGNIVSGVDLGAKLRLKDKLYGLTTPLLTTASGAKMGKTTDGAIWLDSNKLSPYDYWQYFRNVDDRDLIKWLKLFTELSLDEIDDLEKESQNDINYVKKILANKATEICHGKEVSEEACITAEKLFGNNKNIIESSMLNDSSIPIIYISKSKLEDKINPVKLFNVIADSGLCASVSKAKHLIKGGGVNLFVSKKVDNENEHSFEKRKVSDVSEVLNIYDFTTIKDINNTEVRMLRISVGKKKFLHVIIKGD